MVVNLSISNIGWQMENDVEVFTLMKKYGYSGLEIAPTRIFAERPYDQCAEARKWSERLKADYGFMIPSMQSIWFGRQENIFGTEEERQSLLVYTKKAIDFAECVGCKNLVFGCPKNRNFPEGADVESAVTFFKELGDYAVAHNAIIGMEANPPIYHTNFINDTQSAFQLIKNVNSEGFKLNLDLGTMIQNEECIEDLVGKVSYINHVHISEPGLKPIEKRRLHQDLKAILDVEYYEGFVSIEMGRVDDMSSIEDAIKYVKEVFG